MSRRTPPSSAASPSRCMSRRRCCRAGSVRSPRCARPPNANSKTKGDTRFMHAYQDLREFLTVLEQEHQLLTITDQVSLEPDLAAAACALAKIGESTPAIQFEQDRRLHRRPGRDERARLLAQSRAGTRHGQGYAAARPVLRVRPSLPAVSRRAGARADRAVAGGCRRQGRQPLRRCMPLFRLNRGDGGLLHRQGVRRQPRPRRLGQ